MGTIIPNQGSWLTIKINISFYEFFYKIKEIFDQIKKTFH